MVPLARIEHRGDLLDRAPHLGEPKIGRSEAEAQDIGFAKVADHPAPDQRLANRVCFAVAQRDVAASQAKQGEANLAQARKGARQDEIAGADANVASAKAALERAEYALSQRRILSKVDGRVEDVLRRTGEFVPPGGAVVSLLPPGNIKVRFFVPETARSSLNVGREVGVRCDGCGEGLNARVTFIASDAEFTPPVIYSVGSREKLVWMVEAVPTRAGRLSPGQPVDVTLP